MKILFFLSRKYIIFAIIIFTIIFLTIYKEEKIKEFLKNPKIKKMKINIIAIMILIFISLITLSYGSGICAKYFNYNEKIVGKSIIKYKFYNPLFIIRLMFIKDIKYNFYLSQAMNITASILDFTSALFLLILLKNTKNKEETHGSARWASEEEYEKENLLSETEPYNDGVILGRTKKKLFQKSKTFVDNSKTHIAVVAPTRSGKGVGVIIPTLLNWSSSTFTLDMKGENYNFTAGYRSEVLKHKILKFEPYSYESSVSYNPLAEVRLGSEYEVRDATIIANIITDPGEGKTRDHWGETSTALLVGLILLVLYRAEEENRIGTLGDVVDFLTNPDMPVDNSLQEIMTNPTTSNEKHLENWEKYYPSEQRKGIPYNTHPVVARTAAEMLSKDVRERAGIISSVMAKLGLFKDPIIRKNTSKVDFKISDLMDYDTPVDLYVVVTSDSMDTLAPLLRILVTQLIGVLAPKMDFSKETPHNHKLLLMLDEFPAFGTIPLLENSLAYIAGYGMKAVVIAQSLNQIRKRYGDKNSVFDNCATTLFYACTPLDETTPKQISELLGDTTIKVINKSWKSWSLGSVNLSENMQTRKLLTPEEVRNKLSSNKSIISVAGMYPYMATKIKYYEENYFTEKTKYKTPKVCGIERKG